MANDNKNIENLVSEQDDDPTAELELLTEEACAGDDPGQQVESESDANTFDFEKLASEVGAADETIENLKSDLKSRAESISKLQFDIVQLRSRWTGLEKEIKVREEVTQNLTEELNLAHTKQSNVESLLKRRKTKIDSLKSLLAEKEESLTESTRLVDEASTKEREVEARVSELQAQIEAAEKKISARTTESREERSKKQTAKRQAQSLSLEVDNLSKELAASRTAEIELQQYIDRRKAEWDKQESELHKKKDRIEQLSKELDNANAGIRDGRDVQDDLNVRLDSLKTERDDLRKEIMQIQTDFRDEGAQRAASDSKLLASKNFEIDDLKGQMTRTETYADELRNQIQDQLSIAERLETRQKILELLVADAKAETGELADCVTELRSANANLVDDKGTQKERFEREVQQIRLDLEKAQETVAGGQSLNEQLTSDLLHTSELKNNLESRLNLIEEESKATIAKLDKKMKKVETSNQELERKLSNRDDAISAMLNELNKRSEAIESIGEMESVIHELDERMSQSIEDRSSAERERITRLLVGKIDGQKLRFPLFKNRLTIGRTGHNDIQLKAPYISRRHAVIVTDDNGTRIVDWGSKNGVFVNTSRIKERVLRNGDIVTIGTADFKFEERRKR